MSDIITNSSSEVFVKYTKKDINAFKKNIEGVLKIFGQDVNLDEMIEIVPKTDDDVLYGYKDMHELEDDVVPSENELQKYMYKQTEEAFNCGEYAYAMIKNLKIKEKDPQYKDLAKTIQKLVTPFKSEELYC